MRYNARMPLYEIIFLVVSGLFGLGILIFILAFMKRVEREEEES